MEPWFSIIVPVYNVESYLERCIESLLAQNFRDFEIILVDDGSTDASGSICDSYAARHHNITVIHKQNGGLASARNAGMENARGKYISFVDSDDWMESDAYQIIYDSVVSCTPDILNFGCRKMQDGAPLFQVHAVFPEGIYDKDSIRSQILPDSIARERAFHQVDLPVQLSACMCIYKRAFLEGYRLCFEPEQIVLCEDWLFNLSCLCRAESMVILHQSLYNYDTRQNSLSMSYKPDAYERRKKLFDRYLEEVKKTGNYNALIKYRLENFWLESVYLCYVIELNAPHWNCAVRKRIRILCRDARFHEYMKNRTMHNCTIKGLVFQTIVRLRLHGAFRIIYRMIKKR